MFHDLTPSADLLSAPSNPLTVCGVIHNCMIVLFAPYIRLGPSHGLADTLPLASTMFVLGRCKTSFQSNENCHLDEHYLANGFVQIKILTLVMVAQ